MSEEERLRKKSRTRHVSVLTSDTQIGDDIPDGKVMYIWKIVASNNNAAAQALTISKGDSDAARATLMVLDLQKVDIAKHPEFGGDIKSPILKIKPDTVSGGADTHNNQCIMSMETAALDVTIDYYLGNA